MSCSKCETDLVETYDKQTHKWTNTKNHLEYEVNSETDTEQPLILKFLIGNTCILISTLEDEEDTKPDLF